MKNVSCLGSCLVDILLSPLANFPEPKVRTSVFVEELKSSPGGGAANCSVTLANMGINVSLFSKIGNDLHGDYLQEKFNIIGVKTKNTLKRTQRKSTSTVIVCVDPGGERSFLSYHGALSEFSLNDIDLEELYASEILLYPDLFNLPMIDGKPLYDLLENAQQRGILTVLDETLGFSGLQRDVLEACLPFVDYLMPSADDLAYLYPNEKPEELARLFVRKGVQNVILKMGSEGALIMNNERTFKVPAIAKSNEVVDTTGAGDNFSAGFVYGLSLGYSLEYCSELGSKIAALSLKQLGASTRKEDLQSVLKEI